MCSSPVSNLIELRSGVLEMLRDHKRTDGLSNSTRSSEGMRVHLESTATFCSSLCIGTSFAVNNSDFNYPGSILAQHFFF